MNKTKISTREIIIFVIVSIIFILIPFLMAPNITSNQSLFESNFFKKMMVDNILLLIFFYLNYLIFIPKIYFKKQYILYFIIIIACYLIIYNIPDWIFHFKDHPPFDEMPPRGPKRDEFGPKRPPKFNVMWSPKLFLFILMTTVSMFIRQNKRYQEVKEEKQLSEIAYLRAQINPHFLFNTLNNIYALTLQKSDSASDAVMKLSKMMRFVVTDSSKDFVPLQQDLDYIKNYIQLQKLRLVNKNSINFEVIGDTSNLNISPLLLINFIENAFKYGVIDDEDNPITIKIVIENETLTLNVDNTISDVEMEEEKSEIGIKNTKKRLNYIYENRYNLVLNESENHFHVELKIELND